MIGRFNRVKNEFMVILDGFGSPHPDDIAYIPKTFNGLDSYKLGICKLKVIGDDLHVYLRRPGLLIGAKGETINKIKGMMDRKIIIHEVSLTHDDS